MNPSANDRSPGDLIDCSTFIVDLNARKFLSVNLDPINGFNVTVRITIPNRSVFHFDTGIHVSLVQIDRVHSDGDRLRTG